MATRWSIGRFAKRIASRGRAIVNRQASPGPALRPPTSSLARRAAGHQGAGSRAHDAPPSASADSYWDKRKDFVYLHVVRTLMDGLSASVSSAIDIGSNGCPYVTWLPDHVSKASLDRHRPYVGEGVESIKANFLTWQAPRCYDLVTCLQVLEHVPDVKTFCDKLLEISNVLIVSVPYKWPENKNRNHIHDPVDENKMLQWFGFEPNFSYVATEVIASSERLIQVYDAQIPRKWDSLRRRQRLLKKQEKPSR